MMPNIIKKIDQIKSVKKPRGRLMEYYQDITEQTIRQLIDSQKKEKERGK